MPIGTHDQEIRAHIGRVGKERIADIGERRNASETRIDSMTRKMLRERCALLVVAFQHFGVEAEDLDPSCLGEERHSVSESSRREACWRRLNIGNDDRGAPGPKNDGFHQSGAVLHLIGRPLPGDDEIEEPGYSVERVKAALYQVFERKRGYLQSFLVPPFLTFSTVSWAARCLSAVVDAAKSSPYA